MAFRLLNPAVRSCSRTVRPSEEDTAAVNSRCEYRRRGTILLQRKTEQGGTAGQGEEKDNIHGVVPGRVHLLHGVVPGRVHLLTGMRCHLLVMVPGAGIRCHLFVMVPGAERRCHRIVGRSREQRGGVIASLCTPLLLLDYVSSPRYVHLSCSCSGITRR